jgi:hypothetical protein
LFSKIITNSPWYYFLISLLVSAGVAAWLYYKNKKNSEAPRNVLLVLSGLRFLSCFLVALFLLNIFLRHLKNETENPVVLLAIDNSTSMVSSEDSTYVKTTFLDDLAELKKAIGEKYTVKTLLFGGKTETSETGPSFNEKETDIETLISTVENNYSNQNIGALIIATDGIYNKGVNPLYQGEKLGYPLYAIAMGDTNEIKDVLIVKINHNQIAYSGNNFPVEVIVNAKKYAGKDVQVDLMEKGVTKGRQALKINSDNFLSTCQFTLNAVTPGIVNYTAKVTVLEGEKNRSNNSQSFAVEVIDNKEKILLLATAPHPDIAALKDAIANNTSYEIEYSPAQDFKKSLKAYSLIILHGYTPSQQQIINECKNNLIPFWIIGPLSAENLPGVRITGSINRYNDAEPYVQPSFGLFNISDEFKKFSGDLPAIKAFFGNYSLGNGSNSLINQRIGAIETDNPILTFSEANGLKSAVFIGDGLWKWKFRDFAEHKNHNLFNELISKSVQYLSVKSDKSFFRLNSPRIINENTAVEMDAEVYNKSYELITQPDVTLTLKNPENKKFNYTFSKTANAYKLNIGMLPPGEYTYEATVSYNHEVFTKRGMFTIREVVSEKINTVANHQLLYQLSNRTSGKLFYPSEIRKIQNEILKNEQIKPITYSQVSSLSLIDLKWLFWLILGFFALEWFFRKRFLSI